MPQNEKQRAILDCRNSYKDYVHQLNKSKKQINVPAIMYDKYTLHFQEIEKKITDAKRKQMMFEAPSIARLKMLKEHRLDNYHSFAEFKFSESQHRLYQEIMKNGM